MASAHLPASASFRPSTASVLAAAVSAALVSCAEASRALRLGSTSAASRQAESLQERAVLRDIFIVSIAISLPFDMNFDAIIAGTHHQRPRATGAAMMATMVARGERLSDIG